MPTETQQQKLIEVKIAFYLECKELSITSLSNAKEIQRATLVAQRRGLSFTDIHELVREAEALSTQKDDQTASDQKQLLVKQEWVAYQQLTRFERYTSRAKRIAMLTAERDSLQAEADRLFNAVIGAHSATQQKEHDWALQGGIAAGIAGGAAGLAAAMDAQVKNAEIRQQNAANSAAFAPVMMAGLDNVHSLRDRAKRCDQQINEATTKLVAEDDPNTCLERIHFGSPTLTVSETGTCTIRVKAHVDPFLIFDDVNAVVDGTIIAKVYDGDQFIDIAPMVLPTFGLNQNENELVGMCLYTCQKGKHYTVRYAAADLWAMER